MVHGVEWKFPFILYSYTLTASLRNEMVPARYSKVTKAGWPGRQEGENKGMYTTGWCQPVVWLSLSCYLCMMIWVVYWVYYRGNNQNSPRVWGPNVIHWGLTLYYKTLSGYLCLKKNNMTSMFFLIKCPTISFQHIYWKHGELTSFPVQSNVFLWILFTSTYSFARFDFHLLTLFWRASRY